MQVLYHPTDALPFGVCIAIVEGQVGVTIFVDEEATAAQICDGLTQAVQTYINESWLHVGQMPSATAQETREA